MKNTGIIRRIDDLGRIIIPKEIRRTLNIKELDPFEIWLVDDSVCFKKHIVEANYSNSLKSVLRALEDDEDISLIKKAILTAKLLEAIEYLDRSEGATTKE